MVFILRLAMAKTYFLLSRGPRTVDWSCHCTSQKYDHDIFNVVCFLLRYPWMLWHYNKKPPQVPSQLEETDLLLNLPPDRIGHGTFLHPEVGGSESLVDKVVKNNIPLGKTAIKWLSVVRKADLVFDLSTFFFLQSYVWHQMSKDKQYPVTPNIISNTGTSWDIQVWFV